MQNKLYRSVENGNLDKVKKYINLGANVHGDDDLAVQIACLYGKLNIVQYLVSIGANICASNDCALRWASESGHINVVQYLVNIGANIRTNFDYAVRYASRTGHLNIVQFLVESGADFRAYDNEAVRWASECGHSDVVQYLLVVGAYNQDIMVNFNLVNNLYRLGHFDLIYKLYNNNNCKIDVNDIGQFNVIMRYVNKFIEAQKWNHKLFDKLNYTDAMFQFNLS